MADLARKIADAGARVSLSFSDRDLAALQAGIRARHRQRQRRRRRALLAATASTLLAVSIWLVVPRLDESERAYDQSDARVVQFDDGSSATLSKDAELVSNTGKREFLQVELTRGKAQFDVVPNHRRTFQVVAGPAVIDVVGTKFAVERLQETTRVVVQSGKVRVTAQGVAEHLSAGESGTYPRAAAATPANSAGPDTVLTPPLPAPVASTSPNEVEEFVAEPRAVAEKNWRVLAREGEFDQAYQALQQQGPRTLRDDPGELLLYADVARLSGHPSQAVDPLRKITTGYRSDPRAALAAFTLGRLYLEELGNPRAAAEAFQLTRRIEPAGPLTENALAREVEAWSRCGEAARAQKAAHEYVSRYPNGSKSKLVRHYAGLP